jgi:hypothetical protein
MQKTYTVITKDGNQFEVNTFNLLSAKQIASFNCRHQGEKVERVFLKKKLTGRGGAGRGQGRKGKFDEQTKPMRIPLSLVSEVEKLIQAAKK